MVINKIAKTGKKSWDYQRKFNDSFIDRVWDICMLVNIGEDELKQYWENSEYGLVYILNFARDNKRLP